MKYRPVLVVFAFAILPLAMAPSIRAGPFNFDPDPARNPTMPGERRWTMGDASDAVIKVVVRILNEIQDLIVGVFKQIQSFTEALFRFITGYDPDGTSTWIVLSFNVVMTVVFVLVLFALIRVWVWLLDVIPIW